MALLAPVVVIRVDDRRAMLDLGALPNSTRVRLQVGSEVLVDQTRLSLIAAHLHRLDLQIEAYSVEAAAAWWRALGDDS
jgi:hypothetical protein